MTTLEILHKTIATALPAAKVRKDQGTIIYEVPKLKPWRKEGKVNG